MRGVDVGAIRVQSVENCGDQSAAIAAATQDIERPACPQISDLRRAYFGVCNTSTSGSAWITDLGLIEPEAA